MKESTSSNDVKRLFFGFEVEAAWMHPLPTGRILEEQNRHITLAFLGNTSLARIQNDLEDFPISRSFLGLAGRCDRLLFLPEKLPHVVAGHIEWFEQTALLYVHQELISWLTKHGYNVDTRELLSHVTIARSPFIIKDWKEAFSPFPLIAKSLNLYESVGDLSYHSIWNIPFLSIIEEISHTADIAFRIRGKDLQQLFLNAQLALAFNFPDMLQFISDGSNIQDLDDLIIQLNGNVSRADSVVGCPFKAISFHGKITKDTYGFLLWEMIVDV
ncbi:MAG: hypothetical protein H0U49_06480 [Parachlamydiaceae bacterium]|nr:hypothetical protein [Parachlamydiaceae bacterium]